jgi:hypothetical protein
VWLLVSLADSNLHVPAQAQQIHADTVLLPCCCIRRALGAFVLWVLIIHLACLTVHRLRGKRSSVLQLGLNCLLLTTNNTGCIGWPVLIATVGQQSAVLSMLLGKCLAVARLLNSSCCRVCPLCVAHVAGRWDAGAMTGA